MKRDNQRAREAQSKRAAEAKVTDGAHGPLEPATVLAGMPESDVVNDGEVALTEAQEWALEECAQRLADIGRRSTTQAFDYGEELAKVQAILPPKRFGAWLKKNCGISTKAAKNYTRVHKELASYRDRLEKAAFAPTAMFALLGAGTQTIETVIEAAEHGERLTVARVKEINGTDVAPETPEVGMLALPGKAGYLKIAEERMKSNLALFNELLARVIGPVERAVEAFAAGKRVVKADLARAIELDCRHAHDLFELTLAPVRTETPDPRSNWQSFKFDIDAPWGRMQRALLMLGSEHSWKKSDEFKPWLVDEVYPLLKFAVRGEALAGDDQDMADEAVEIADQSNVTQPVPPAPAPKRSAAKADTNVIPMKRQKLAEPELS